MTDMPTRIEEFKTAMAKDWETYHATYECSDDEDLAEMLVEGKTLEGALALAKKDTDRFNEMQSNCY